MEQPTREPTETKAQGKQELGTHHAADIEVRRVSPFIVRDTFDTSLLNIELPRQPLQLSVQRIAVHKTLPGDSAIAAVIHGRFAHLGGFFEIGLDSSEHGVGNGKRYAYISTAQNLKLYRRRDKKPSVRNQVDLIIKSFGTLEYESCKAQVPSIVQGGRGREGKGGDGNHIFLFSFFLSLQESVGGELLICVRRQREFLLTPTVTRPTPRDPNEYQAR